MIPFLATGLCYPFFCFASCSCFLLSDSFVKLKYCKVLKCKSTVRVTFQNTVSCFGVIGVGIPLWVNSPVAKGQCRTSVKWQTWWCWKEIERERGEGSVCACVLGMFHPVESCLRSSTGFVICFGVAWPSLPWRSHTGAYHSLPRGGGGADCLV